MTKALQALATMALPIMRRVPLLGDQHTHRRIPLATPCRKTFNIAGRRSLSDKANPFAKLSFGATPCASACACVNLSLPSTAYASSIKLELCRPIHRLPSSLRISVGPYSPATGNDAGFILDGRGTHLCE